MNYATGCAFNLDEIFMNLDKSKLKLTSKQCEKINNDPHKNALIQKIFRESVKLILNDVIDNNVTFELPTGARKSNIYMKRYHEQDFAKGRQNGKWKEIDYLKSDFSGYQLVLSMSSKNGGKERIRPIYLNKEYKDKIIKYTNEGKQYC